MKKYEELTYSNSTKSEDRTFFLKQDILELKNIGDS